MNRLMTPALTIALALLVQGCASRPALAPSAQTAAPNGQVAAAAPVSHQQTPESPVRICVGASGCEGRQGAAMGFEVGVEPNAPFVEGHPLTSVVVTQCNLLVAVYMTMPDGRLLRFDKRSNVPAEQLVATAYTATRSERVEVACEGQGAVGFEAHQPI